MWRYLGPVLLVVGAVMMASALSLIAIATYLMEY